MQALTYLQRALLVHDLQTLDAAEWESCFNKVRSPPGSLRVGDHGGGDDAPVCVCVGALPPADQAAGQH